MKITSLHSKSFLKKIITKTYKFTEIFKAENDIESDFMKNVFRLKESYNLRSESNNCTFRNVKTTYYGLIN